MRAQVKQILDKLGVNIAPGEVMSHLSVGQQQMIEIAKALMVDAKVIIMDEPTAALTQSETEVLFKVVKSLREKEYLSYTFLIVWKKSLNFATALQF